MSLESVYGRIGQLYVLNYAAKGGKVTKKKNCVKGWACGYTCLPQTKENCGSPLKGQAATYAEWLSKQAKKSSTGKSKKSQAPKTEKAKPVADEQKVKEKPIAEVAKEPVKETTKEAVKQAKEEPTPDPKKEAAEKPVAATKEKSKPVSSSKPDGERTEYAETWKKAWKEAPDALKEVLRVIDDPKKLRSADPWPYHRLDSIHMAGFKPDTPAGSVAWRHEYGHHIDVQLRNKAKTGGTSQPDLPLIYFSTGNVFNNARRQDEQLLIENAKEKAKAIKSAVGRVYVGPRTPPDEAERIYLNYSLENSLRKTSQKTGKSIPEIVEEKFQKLPSDSIAKKLLESIPKKGTKKGEIENLKRQVLAAPDDPVTIAKLYDRAFGNGVVVAEDLIGSTTKNKVGLGHSDDYYQKSPFAQNTEAFANIVAMHGSGNPLAVETLRKLVPSQFAAYEQALSEALQ